ncbi:phage antirepressor KilAC domain-containing protein [Brevibacillus composti]|uniref:Phage antirepressor KilAC domain-containing protein n=1 Tax=Brevibacillus composti TaxID=2796470 RepID=A0A7T5ENB0_9BACL|nr:phage antirepressor KilAC domain-containing protein [Brevibacillus composti]QQE75687.1 phage antirepressor KilAC domain-containing protein [Brevibacillus composti]QUO42713.1 phage antirepressor KilAC domain-containing protein [Brevibacillus composti]
MDKPQIFNHQMFGELPVIIVDGVEWFGATEAAEALSFAKPHDAISNHVDEDDSATYGVTDSLGRSQQKKFINESGLYSLIFGAAKQGKNLGIQDKAKAFKRWVTGEVLPTIRKTGGYVANDDLFIDTYLPHADEQTKMTFRATLALVRKQNEQIEAMKPKAEYFDALVDRNLLTNFRDTAKELKVKERDFIAWLLEKGYVYRDQKGKLKPYAQHVPELFNLKEWERNGKADVQTLITPKGKETFRLLMAKSVA